MCQSLPFGIGNSGTSDQRIAYRVAPELQIRVSFKATGSVFDEFTRVLQIMMPNLECVQ